MAATINRRDSLAFLGGGALAGDTRRAAPGLDRGANVGDVPSLGNFTFADLPRQTIDPGVGGFFTCGYDTPGLGSGAYLRCTGSGPFLATSWRRQSRDGQWFEKDEREVDLTHMGARGAGDDTQALLAAFAWLNEQPGRRLQVPRGSFTTEQDLPILADSACLIGLAHGRGEIVLANGATLRAGHRVSEGRDSDGRLRRTLPGKVLFPRIENIGIKATGTHSQDCLVLEHADNAYLHLLDISHFKTANGVRIGGVRTRWVQWTTLDHVFVNTNEVGLTVELAHETAENEDHFLINACQFYIGKQPVKDARPACIRIDSQPGRSTPMWNFHVSGRTHFLGWKQADNPPATTGPILTSGIMLVQPNDGCALRLATVRDAFFEDVSFPIDLRRGVTGADVSAVHTQGCSFMEAHTVFTGIDWSKHSVTAADNHYINGGFVCDGNIRTYHRGFNRMSGMKGFDRLNNLFVHQWERKTLCLEGIQLEARGTVEVAPGQESVTLRYELTTVHAQDCRPTSLIATWPDADPYPVSVGPHQAVIRFARPPAQRATLHYLIEA